MPVTDTVPDTDPDATPVPALEVVGVTVGFGGLLALDDVTLDAQAGIVTGLIGPNGAGKTTLFNAICGLQSMQRGQISLCGRPITRSAPHVRARRGLARTFQRLEVFGSLSVRDNVRVAAEIHNVFSDVTGEADAVVDPILERVGIGDIADEYVDALPTGQARLVELARALATEPKVLLLDEPSSGLDPSETREMGTLLTEIGSEGLAILLVEHDVGLVMSTCARIHVLEFGTVIAQGTPDEIRGDEQVQAAYLGSSTT
ncbi:MAG: ABC transporter ATP-binding protein [Acidimicrobiia bacterium]